MPLGRLRVQDAAPPGAILLDEIDRWLGSLRSFCRMKEAAQRHHRARRGVEDAIFSYCQRPGARQLQSVLAALGRAEHDIARSPSARHRVRPLRDLSPQWLKACDDGSREFRIAAALGSIWNSAVGPIRQQMEPVDTSGVRPEWSADRRSVVWGGGDICRNLAAILERRCVEAQMKPQSGQTAEHAPLGARFSVGLADVERFLAGDVDERLLSALLWGCAAINWADYDPREHGPGWQASAAPDLPRPYALLKMCFLPHPLRLDPQVEPVTIRPERAILGQLRAGRLDTAVQLAWRRLHAAGLTPLTSRRGRQPSGLDLEFQPGTEDRLAASLLIPVLQIQELAKMVLRQSQSAAQRE